ncbi:MAG: hypothetical protein ABR557_11455 [Pyrinomonadaceae bacterium]
MAKTRKKATKPKSRKSITKAKSRKRTVAARSRKSAAKTGKSAKRATTPKARKRVAPSKSRKFVARSKARKLAKKAHPRKPAQQAGAIKPSAESPRAVRLTFSYQGDQVKLISQQPVEMTVPPSDPVKGYEQQKGFWAEVKNDQDKTLFRRVLHNPTRNDAEVFTDDPEQSIARAPAPKRKGVFTVVVPKTDKDQDVTLSRSAGQPDVEPEGAPRGRMALRSLATGPATEIARFKLKK